MPAEKNIVELRIDQVEEKKTEVEPNDNHVEEKTEEEASSDQVEEKEVDQDEDKVILYQDV